MRPRQEIGSEKFGGMVVIDDLGMGLLGGSGNRFETGFGNGFPDSSFWTFPPILMFSP